MCSTTIVFVPHSIILPSRLGGRQSGTLEAGETPGDSWLNAEIAKIAELSIGAGKRLCDLADLCV
jgi:hypothetical protein